VIANLPVQFQPAAMLHSPNEAAITAAGVSSAPTTSAVCRCRTRLALIRGPKLNRILTRIVRYQSNSFCVRLVVRKRERKA
jgi:hypothetical protein